jgi:hypothetical protein
MAEIIEFINTSLNIKVKDLYNVAGKLAEDPEDLQETGNIEGFYYIKSSAYYFLVTDKTAQSYLIN